MSEEFEIKLDGAVAQSNSGRGKHNKGDAKLGPFVYDIKEYTKSFAISKDVWAKICTDAITSGRYQPALKIVLGENDGQKTRVWVISDAMFKEMLESWEKEYYV